MSSTAGLSNRIAPKSVLGGGSRSGGGRPLEGCIHRISSRSTRSPLVARSKTAFRLASGSWSRMWSMRSASFAPRACSSSTNACCSSRAARTAAVSLQMRSRSSRPTNSASSSARRCVGTASRTRWTPSSSRTASDRSCEPRSISAKSCLASSRVALTSSCSIPLRNRCSRRRPTSGGSPATASCTPAERSIASSSSHDGSSVVRACASRAARLSASRCCCRTCLASRATSGGSSSSACRAPRLAANSSSAPYAHGS